MTVLDHTTIRTEPGLGDAHTFSPPAGFAGDGEAYRQLMRLRVKDLMHGQRMKVIAMYARTAGMPTITGPYATEARLIIGRLMPPPRSLDAHRA